MIIDGTAIPPRSAKKIPAALELGSHGRLQLKADDQLMAESVQEMAVSASLGSIPRTLTFADGWTFTPGNQHNSDLLNQWLREHHGKSLLHKLESHAGLIFLALVFTVVLSGWTFFYGIPRLADTIANALPASVYQHVGEGTDELFDYLGFAETELAVERQQQLSAVFHSLQAVNKSYNVQPRFITKNWSGGMNAFALADGTVVMTDQMVNSADNDQELAAVMLHELGHVYYNHAMAQLVRASIVSVIVAYVVGDVSGVGDILVSSGALGLTLAYSREAEAQADDFALTQMAQQYGTVEPMLVMFKRLAGEVDEESPQWLSTHPGMADRMQKIEQFQSNLPSSPVDNSSP